MALERDDVARVLPSYEIGDELGRGAWGVVISARHRALGRHVAVKQLPRAFAADPAVRARFVTEARLLASLDHPHVVPVFDFVEKDGLCVLVMELLPGGTVWNRFSGQGFTPPAACATVLAAAAGLQAAHEKSVLHRDVKPENLMFSSEGVLKVTDFGIAKVVGGDSTLATRAGEVLGTPAYIAPEQARGAALSPATDVYALATMLYELLSGQLPFPEEADAMALLFKHAYEDPVPLDQNAPNVPPPVVPVVMRGLATAPEDRYRSAEAFAEALAEGCTSVWGPGWLAAESVPVMGAGPVVAITERVSVSSPGQPVTAGPAGGTVASSGPTSPGPTVAGRPPPPPLQRARATVVRPAATERAGGTGLTELEPASFANLVPVQQIVKSPPRPRLPLAIAIVAFAAAVVIAFTGVGGSSLGGTLPPGSVEVAGVPLRAGAVPSLNLSGPVVVRVLESGPAATTARMALVLMGHQAFQSSAPLVADGNGGHTASVDLTKARYVVTGHTTAQVDLIKDGSGATAGYWRFIADLSQPAWLSVEGIVLVLLALFSLAYIEQFSRSLWRGRRRASATPGLAMFMALLALVFVGVAWLAAGRQPTLAAAVVCAALGAISGAALAEALYRGGRWRRLRRRAARRAGPPAAALSSSR
ncbi:MAG TPA: serine/threonine-protein kinase [Acidimicrobiales bacterium]|nr:serine/threonine-protein kinase [Acidimicrobiales bacterium]